MTVHPAPTVEALYRAILTAEPEGPSPLEETLRNIHGTLRALDERLQRIEQALTK